MEFDQTQALPLWDDEDDHDVPENDEPKAFLQIPEQTEVPDFLELPLHKGSNTIGRSVTCKICIHSKVLSKEHAVIEIDNNSFLIYDRGSLNKTWKGKTLLKPNIRYNLESNEDLTFGNIKTKFIIKESDRKEIEDSGSETGSESMLLLHEQCTSPPTILCENVLDSDAKQIEVPADKKQCSLPPTLPYENVLDSDEEPNEFPADRKEIATTVPYEVELAATVPYECALESDEDAKDSSVVIEETLPATVPYVNLPYSDDDTNELPTVEQNDAAVVAISTDLGHELPKKQSPSTENIKDTQLSYPATQLYIGNEINAADMPTQKINNEDGSDNSDWEKESNDDVSLLPPTQPFLTVANEKKSKTQEQCESKIIDHSSNVPEKSREEMLNTSTFNIPENATNSKENRDNKQFLDEKSHPRSTSEVEIIDDNEEPEVFDETFLNAETQPFIDDGKGDMDDIILLRADQNARLSYINKYMSGEDDSLPPTQLYVKHDSCTTKAASKSSEQSIATTKSRAAFEESSKNILSGINATAADESVLNDDDIILCPSTQRRSDTRDAVKRGDECSSPVLRSEVDSEVEVSIAETPPHLLTESESTGSPSASKDNGVLKFIINMSNSMTENDTYNELNETVLNTDSDGACKSGNDSHNKDKIPSPVSDALIKNADLQMINSTKVKTNSEQSHAFNVEEKGNKGHIEHHEANGACEEITPGIKNKKSLVNASKKQAPKGDIASGTVIDTSGKVNCDNLDKVIASSKIASNSSDPKTKSQKRTSRRKHSEETIEEISKFIELSETSIARNQTNENIKNSIVQCTEESETLVNDMTHKNIESETKKGSVKRKSAKAVSGGKNQQQNESSSETKTTAVDQPSINAFAQEPTRRSRRSRTVPLKLLENGTRSNSKVEAVTIKQDQETMSKNHSAAKVTKERKTRKSKCVEPNDNIVFQNLVGKTSEKVENSAVHSLEKNEMLDDERKSIHNAERDLKANGKSELDVNNKLNEQVKKSKQNAKKITVDQTSKSIAQERPTRQSRRSCAVQSKLSEKETVSNDKIKSVVGKQKQGTVSNGRKRTRQTAQQDKSQLDETGHHVKIPDVSLEMQNQNDHDDSLSHERKTLRVNQKCKQEAKLIVKDLEKPVYLVESIDNDAKHYTMITRKNSQHSSNEHLTSSEPTAKSRRKTDIPENQHLSPVIETKEGNKNSKLLSIEKSPRSRGRPKRERKSVTKQDFFYCKDGVYNSNEVSTTVLNNSHGINTLPEIKMTFIKVPETKHSALKEAKKGKRESISVIASAEIKTGGNSSTASALVTDSNVKDNFSRRKQRQKNEGQTLSNEFIDKHSSSTANNDSTTAVNIDKKKVLSSDNLKTTRKTRSRIKKHVKNAVLSSEEDVSDITNTSFISSSSCKDSETTANNASINKSNKTNSRKSRAIQKQGVSPEIIASLPSPAILENTISEDAKSVDSTPSKASGRKRRQMTKHSVSSHSSDVAMKDESTDEQLVLLSTSKSHSTSKFQTDISSSSEKEAKLVESGRGHRKRGISKEENEDEIVSPQRRRLSRIIKPKVMFTGVGDEEEQKIVANLGGELVEDIGPCTHLVTDKLRRTVKALCCIAKGIPLVNVKWLQQCKKSNSFIDHAPFLIKDRNAEKQYGFQLKETLEKAAQQPLFTSWSIHVTPKVVPSPEQMKDIIHWAGGKHLTKMPNRLSTRTVIISCDSDLKLCTHAAKCGIPVVGAEFLLTGLLRYQIDVNSYKLNLK